MIFKYFFFSFLCATLFALLEIQIEGKNGWAGKLPTWKIYKKWFKYIPGGNKPITGYHFYFWTFLASISHLTFLFSQWSLGKELITISFIILVLRVEDFLWFVFNPHYGIRKFKPGLIAWHKSWIGFLPSQYYISLFFWLVFLLLGLHLD